MDILKVLYYHVHIKNTERGLISKTLNPGFQFLTLHCIVVQKSAQ